MGETWWKSWACTVFRMMNIGRVVAEIVRLIHICIYTFLTTTLLVFNLVYIPSPFWHVDCFGHDAETTRYSRCRLFSSFLSCHMISHFERKPAQTARAGSPFNSCQCWSYGYPTPSVADVPPKRRCSLEPLSFRASTSWRPFFLGGQRSGWMNGWMNDRFGAFKLSSFQWELCYLLSWKLLRMAGSESKDWIILSSNHPATMGSKIIRF